MAYAVPYAKGPFISPIVLFGTGKTSIKANSGRYLEAAQNGGLFIGRRWNLLTRDGFHARPQT